MVFHYSSRTKQCVGFHMDATETHQCDWCYHRPFTQTMSVADARQLYRDLFGLHGIRDLVADYISEEWFDGFNFTDEYMNVPGDFMKRHFNRQRIITLDRWIGSNWLYYTDIVDEMSLQLMGVKKSTYEWWIKQLAIHKIDFLSLALNTYEVVESYMRTGTCQWQAYNLSDGGWRILFSFDAMFSMFDLTERMWSVSWFVDGDKKSKRVTLTHLNNE